MPETSPVSPKKKKLEYNPKTNTFKPVYLDAEGQESDLDSNILEENLERYKLYCMRYCIGLYYWYKTGRNALISDTELTELHLMEYHYFSLRFDAMKKGELLENLSMMLGGSSKARKK